MQERPFLDQSDKPTEQTLQAALGGTYDCCQQVLVLASAFSQEWTHTKSCGWMLKVYDRKKALFYLIPLQDGFRISLAIREAERDAFLRDDELRVLKDQISSSKKYPEGFALQFHIGNEVDFEPLEVFIRRLIALRA